MAGERGPFSVEEPRWPLLLGWACVFYAIYSLLDLLHSVFQYLIIWHDSSTSPPVWFLVLWLLQEATVVGALVGGRLIQRRKRSARRVICVYAAAALLLSLALAIGAAFALGSATNPYGIAAGSLGLASSMALPAFVLIWFARPAVRQEVAGWRRRGDSRRPADGPRWPWIVAAASLATAYVDLSAGIQHVVGLIHMVRSIAQASGVGLTGALGQVSTWSLPSMAVLSIAPLLVAGAILLLKRRRLAVWPHLIWAGLRLLLLLVYAATAYGVLRWVFTGLYLPPSLVLADVFCRMGRLGLYPMFLLIWFLHPRIRRELRAWAAKRAP
ncbi:MAG: hypothetical protein WBF17_15410 [Phycisphaerae bacterium]